MVSSCKTGMIGGLLWEMLWEMQFTRANLVVVVVEIVKPREILKHPGMIRVLLSRRVMFRRSAWEMSLE